LSDGSIAQLGFALIIFGFILAFVAAILLAVRSRGGGTKTRGAGILLVGPIPIIFGTDRESVKVLVVLAIVLMAVVLIFLLLPSLILTQ
jgi:uncharacterized protein (TIGR00304 family)